MKKFQGRYAQKNMTVGGGGAGGGGTCCQAVLEDPFKGNLQ